MNELPDKLETETEQEFELFVAFIRPECSPRPVRSILDVCELTGLAEKAVHEVAERNQWRARALSYDLKLLKQRQKKPTQDPAPVVANALIKLAGNTLAGTAPKAAIDEETITKAVKLIEGYRKLK